MRTGLAIGALGIVVTAGSAMLAAPQGQGQDRPGQMGQAKVFVENSGKTQAVPVALQDVAMSTPLGVQIVGTPAVTLPPTAVVQTRSVRQAWDYRTLNIVAAQDPAPALSAAGTDGWEVAGIIPAASGSVFLLKRPR